MAAVRRVEAGESPEFVAAGLGINRRTIYRWIEAFHYGGERDATRVTVDGVEQANQAIALVDDHREHRLEVRYRTTAAAMAK